MSAFKAKKLGYLAAATTLLALVVAQGCGSDDDQEAPAAAGKSSAGAGGKSSSGGAGKASTNGGESSKAGAGDTTEEGGAGGSPDVDMGMGGEAGSPTTGPECTDPTGCYSCEPKTNTQFLNHCVEGGCPAHFDNSTLMYLDKVGTL